MKSKDLFQNKLRLIVITLALGVLLLGLPLLLISPAQGAATQEPNFQPAQTTTTWLEIQKGGPETTFAGAPVRYTIRITNTSGSVLNNVTLTDTWTTRIPQTGMWARGILALYNGTYEVTPPGAVAQHTYLVNLPLHRGEAYWYLNPIANGQAVEIVITMTTPITLEPALAEYAPWGRVGPSSVENSVVAGAPGRTNVQAPVVTSLVVAPLVRLTKSADGEAAPAGNCRVGRLVTYTIQVQNLTVEGSTLRPDAWPAEHLSVWDQLPTQLWNTSYLTSSASQPGVVWNFDAASGFLTWVYPDDFVLQPGQSTYLTITARVPPDAAYNPPTSLVNGKYTLQATADHRFKPANQTADVKLYLLSPFDKTVQTSSPPTSPNHTYPNRVITYTVTFYNPLQTPLSGMVLTDTLDPNSLATYHRMIQGPDPVQQGSVIRWEGLDVPANGTITLIFEAFVPPNTPIKPNCSTYTYYNAVSATHPGFPVTYLGHNNNRLASFVVDPQILVSKLVAPSLQLPGQDVTYTVRLQNRGNTDIPGPVIITDTLPLGFTYSGMVSSPPPGEPAIPFSNILVWNDIPGIAAGQMFTFSFRATVNGIAGESYANLLDGYNAATSICSYSGAKVKIDVPLRINKVASPTTVIQGEILTYQAQILNISPSQTFSVTEFRDTLPGEMRDAADHDGTYQYVITPPAVLTPSVGTWTTPVFPVIVQGYGVGTSWCNGAYPSRSVSQATGNVEFNLYNEGWAANVGSLAPVEVIPQGYLLQSSPTLPAAVNQTLRLTLTLQDNRTSPITPITGIELKWTVPRYNTEVFTVISTTLPPSPSSSLPNYYIWENLTIPLGGQLHIVIEMRAPQPNNANLARNYSSVAEVLTLDDMALCIPKSSFNIGVVRGIEIVKTPSPVQVGPYGTVQYTLKVRNLTGAVVTNVVITDVLPYNWEFISMLSGPAPLSIDPPIWQIDQIPAKGEIVLRFYVRTYTLLGGWINEVQGTAPINLGYTSSYTDDVVAYVVSGIGFFKTAGPSVINAGETSVYTLTLYNGAADYDMQSLVITDTLPPMFTFEQMLGGPTPQVVGNQLVWAITSNLLKGQKLILSFRVRANDQSPSGFYYNEATAQATSVQNGAPIMIPPTGPTAPIYIHGVPTVQVNKSVAPSAVRAGNPVTYTLTLYNETDQAYALRVTDTLPYSLTFTAALDPPNATVLPGPREQVIWNGLSIAPQETLTLTFQATVARLASDSSYCNDVQVQMGSFILPPHLGLACLDVSPIPRVDAQIDKSDGRDQVAAGDILTYTIHYTNSAASTAALHTVALTETLAPLTYVTVLANPGWQPLGDGRYRLDVTEPLSPGLSGEAEFVVQLASSVPAAEVLSVHNRVEIGYTLTEEAVENNLANNVAVDDDLWQGPDLVITGLWFEPLTPLPGQPLHVHLELTNQGNVPITQRYDGTSDPGWWLFVAELYIKGTGFVPSGPPTNVFDHVGGYCVDAACSALHEDYLVWPYTFAPGQSRAFTLDIIAPPAGVYHLYAQADVMWPGWYGGQPFGIIRETFEDNNIFTGPTMTVGASNNDHWLYLPLITRAWISQ